MPRKKDWFKAWEKAVDSLFHVQKVLAENDDWTETRKQTYVEIGKALDALFSDYAANWEETAKTRMKKVEETGSIKAY